MQKQSGMETEPDLGLLGMYRDPHREHPSREHSICPQIPWGTEESPSARQSLGNSPWPWAVLTSSPFHLMFSNCLRKNSCHYKANGLSVKTSLVSRPQWHIWRERADEGEMPSGMQNSYYILIFLSPQKVRRQLALGHHFHIASSGC